jgi:hypothetical protein
VKLSQVHSMKEYRKSGGITPRILKYGSKWKWSTSHPGCYSPRIDPRYLLNMRLDEPQCLSGWFWIKEKSVASNGIRTPDRPGRSIDNVPTH